jgi:hypothetical protein
MPLRSGLTGVSRPLQDVGTPQAVSASAPSEVCPRSHPLHASMQRSEPRSVRKMRQDAKSALDACMLTAGGRKSECMTEIQKLRTARSKYKTDHNHDRDIEE